MLVEYSKHRLYLTFFKHKFIVLRVDVFFKVLFCVYQKTNSSEVQTFKQVLVSINDIAFYVNTQINGCVMTVRVDYDSRKISLMLKR